VGYDESAEFYGIYLWEYLHVIYPLPIERTRALGRQPPSIFFVQYAKRGDGSSGSTNQ